MIDEFGTLNRLGKCYLFVENVSQIGLNDKAQALMVDRLSMGIKNMILQEKFITSTSDPKQLSKEDIAQKIQDDVEKENTAVVRNYNSWLLNYGLVMLCSIFDNFLLDLLTEILNENPTLCSWSTKGEILGTFENSNMKQKSNVFIYKLRMTETEFFDLSQFRDDIQQKYKGFNFLKLIEIYKKRDKAAHTDSYVLKDISELKFIRELFEKLVLNLSYKARGQWRVKSKMVELFRNGTLK